MCKWFIHVLAFIAVCVSPAVLAIAQTPTGALVGPNSVDATKFTGADICAKIAAAATYLYNATGGSNGSGGWIDARGFTGDQPCATNPFANWPASANGAGSAPLTNFDAEVLLGRVTILTNVPWIITGYTSLRGQDMGMVPIAGSAGQSYGTNIQASNTFPSYHATGATITNGTPGTVTVKSASYDFPVNQILLFESNSDVLPTGLTYEDFYYVTNKTGSACTDASTGCTFNLSSSIGVTAQTFSGSPSGTHKILAINPILQAGQNQFWSGTPENDFSVRVNNLSLYCGEPAGAAMLPGSIGLFWENAQELSEAKRIQARGCQIDFWIGDNAGDTNTLAMWNANDSGVTTVLNTFQCLKVGSTSAVSTAGSNQRWKTSTLLGFNCYMNNPGNSVLTMPSEGIINIGTHGNEAFFGIQDHYGEFNSANLTIPVFIGLGTSGATIGSSTAELGENVTLRNMIQDGSQASVTGISMLGTGGYFNFENIFMSVSTNILLYAAAGCTITKAHQTDGKLQYFASAYTIWLRGSPLVNADCPDLNNSTAGFTGAVSGRSSLGGAVQ